MNGGPKGGKAHPSGRSGQRGQHVLTSCRGRAGALNVFKVRGKPLKGFGRRTACLFCKAASGRLLAGACTLGATSGEIPQPGGRNERRKQGWAVTRTTLWCSPPGLLAEEAGESVLPANAHSSPRPWALSICLTCPLPRLLAPHLGSPSV